MPFSAMRNSDEIKMRGVLLLSAFLHLLFLSLAFGISIKERPRWTFGPIHSVELVSLAAVSPGQPGKPTMTREIAPNALSRHPAIILRKPIDIVPAEPLKRIELARKEARPVPKISDEVRTRAAAQPQHSQASPAPAAQTGKSPLREESPAGGGATPSSEAEISSRMQAYYTQIWIGIKGQWTIAPPFMPKGNVSATVVVKIATSGVVTDISFEQKSGNNYFDESTIRAIKKASPFPPLPEWINSAIEIGIRFHSSDLR
ncbi:MAG: TonB family protein [Smithellaceae bacterium]|nr:TonB family protein [Smithellaceae bacterium]